MSTASRCGVASQLILFDTGIDVAAVRGAKERLMQSARSVNTERAYASSWRAFCSWCSDAGRGSLPATPDTLSLFIAWSVDEGFRLKTVWLRVAAIVRRHRDGGFSSPVDDGVRSLLSSAARERKEVKAGKAALTPRQLRRICGVLQRDGGAMALRDRAAILLGFAAGWRRSSLSSLDLADVQFRRRGMLVTLRSSKTDQVGAGLLIGVPFGSAEGTCPVRALREWVRLRGRVAGPLFTRISASSAVSLERLSGETLNDRVKLALERIGVDPAPYGAHSLRAGYATAAAEAGASDIAIMQRAGWKSMQTVLGYVRPAQAFRSDPLAGVL